MTPTLLWIESNLPALVYQERDRVWAEKQKNHPDPEKIEQKRLWVEDIAENPALLFALKQPSFFQEPLWIEIMVYSPTLISTALLSLFSQIFPLKKTVIGLIFLVHLPDTVSKSKPGARQKNPFLELQALFKKEQGVFRHLQARTAREQYACIDQSAQTLGIALQAAARDFLQKYTQYHFSHALECLKMCALYYGSSIQKPLSVSDMKPFLGLLFRPIIQDLLQTLRVGNKAHAIRMLERLREQDYPLPLLIWGFLDFIKGKKVSENIWILLAQADRAAKNAESLQAFHLLSTVCLALLDPSIETDYLIWPDPCSEILGPNYSSAY